MKTRATAALLAAMLLPSTAYAACEVKLENAKVVLSLSEFKGYSEVMIRVFRDGFSGEDLHGSGNMREVIAYQTQTATDRNGHAEVEFYLDESGKYRIEIGELGGSETQTYVIEDYADADYGLDLMKEINAAIAAGDIESVRDKIESNYAKLGMAAELYEGVKAAGQSVSEIYGLITNGSEISDIAELEKMLNNCAMIVKLHSLSVDDAKTFFEANVSKTTFAQSGMYAVYSEKMSDTAKDAAIERIKAADVTSYDDALERYTEIVVTSSIREALGASTVKDILTLCRDELGIDLDKCSRLKSPSSVYQALCGAEVSTLDDVAKAYENAYNAQLRREQSGSSSGGGGGGGGGGGSSGSTPYTIVKEPSSESSSTPTDDNKDSAPTEQFSDLSGYEWARESIYDLYMRGIVSGRTENSFVPGDYVTREEFVKLIVAALDIYDTEAKCAFDDVSDGAWFYGYVASAVKGGIIEGVSDRLFGTGSNITREDAAVIINRAMGGKNADASVLSNVKDSADISDYAVEAVAAMYETGILTGNDDGVFQPKNGTTRAEAAVIISRMLNYR